MSYTVAAVSDARGLHDFLMLPFEIYRCDPNWVAPIISEVRRTLDPAKNPYFAAASLALFVCYRGRIPAARLALIINRRHEEKFGVRTAFFGFFEARSDLGAARALLSAAEIAAREQGARALEGPFNPNHYSELGFQLDGFGTPPGFFQTYNPSYYPDFLELAGYRLSRRFQTMRNDDIRGTVLRRFGDPARPPAEAGGYRVRSLNKRDLAGELERMREVNNAAFAPNWHFLPLSREEYLFSAKYLSVVTRPDLIKIVENKGEPAAVLHCVLDVNPLLRELRGRVGPFRYLRFIRGRKHIRTLVIYTVAIKPAHQHTLVYKLLLQAFCRMAGDFEALEATWISPDNTPALRAAEHLELEPDKHFGIFEKKLS
jgi:hypothetical protein